MAVDERTDQLMGHLEAMIQLLQEMDQDMQQRKVQETKKENPSKSKLEFYESQSKRLAALQNILEEDVLEMLIGIRNISGPIEYFQK